MAASGDTASTAPSADVTEDYDSGRQYLGHETAAATGSRTIGWAGSCGSHAVSGATYALAPRPSRAAHIGMSMGLRGGTIEQVGPVQLPIRRLRGLLMGLRRGALAFTAKRQVALVGEGIETAEMTEGGTEGQVLTQHTGRKPSWEDASGGGAEELGDLTDVTVTGSESDGQVLTSDGAGGFAFENSASGFSNPMTTEGDVIVGGTSGAADRLAVGDEDDVLTCRIRRADVGGAVRVGQSARWLQGIPLVDIPASSSRSARSYWPRDRRRAWTPIASRRRRVVGHHPDRPVSTGSRRPVHAGPWTHAGAVLGQV